MFKPIPERSGFPFSHASVNRHWGRIRRDLRYNLDLKNENRQQCATRLPTHLADRIFLVKLGTLNWREVG